MKKKIVYISGAETFCAADVRAAFDEVRATLNLDSDTVLFGVPIDNLDEQNESVHLAAAEPEPECATDIEAPAPAEPAFQESAVLQQTETMAETDSNVVPILSVLGTKTEPIALETAPETMDEIPDLTDAAPSEVQTDDILTDDMPTETAEQTLEELLEKMTPLREDIHIVEPQDDATESEADAIDTKDDATLENLASEFAKVQDTMPVQKKTPERGKISKLKNILPFKKIKRDDSGLMGDLFGWAGIAANDDDFSMPGFFTGVASKK